jgi:hypothetical protein
MKWTSKKPLRQGRYWWTNQEEKTPRLVFVEEQCLGLYVVGMGWLPYQQGKWAGPMPESGAQVDNN